MKVGLLTSSWISCYHHSISELHIQSLVCTVSYIPYRPQRQKGSPAITVKCLLVQYLIIIIPTMSYPDTITKDMHLILK